MDGERDICVYGTYMYTYLIDWNRVYLSSHVHIDIQMPAACRLEYADSFNLEHHKPRVLQNGGQKVQQASSAGDVAGEVQQNFQRLRGWRIRGVRWDRYDDAGVFLQLESWDVRESRSVFSGCWFCWLLPPQVAQEAYGRASTELFGFWPESWSTFEVIDCLWGNRHLKPPRQVTILKQQEVNPVLMKLGRMGFYLEFRILLGICT